MKKIILLLVVIASLNFVSHKILESETNKSNTLVNLEEYSSLKANISKLSKSSDIDYDFNIDFVTDNDSVHVLQNVMLHTDKSLYENEIFFENLSSRWSAELKNLDIIVYYQESYKTDVEIRDESLKISDKLELDGYLVKIPNSNVKPDSVFISFEYSLHLPSNSIRNDFGVALGKLFYFFADWYYRPVYRNTENELWKNYNLCKTFGDYTLKINCDKEFTFGGTCSNFSMHKAADSLYSFSSRNCQVKEFCWFAGENIDKFTDTLIISANRKVKINYFLQDENLGYLDRFKEFTPNAISFLDTSLQPFNREVINILELPATYTTSRQSYPSLVTVAAEFLSPPETHNPEKYIVKGLVNQYIKNGFVIDEDKDLWIQEAIPEYLADVFMDEHFGKSDAIFRLATFYPIYGVNFFQYNEIPIIYTLGVYKKDMGSDLAYQYYFNNLTPPLSMAQSELPDEQTRDINSLNKPYLFLLSYESLVGRDTLLQALSGVLNKDINEYLTTKLLLNSFVKINPELKEFVERVFFNSGTLEYKVKYIEDNKVYLERLGEGVFPMDVALYTDKDTLYKFWDGKSRHKIITYDGANELLAAELDPFRKNKFDSNIANNSYTVSKKFLGPWAISMRWFFWVQNALMIFGSVG